MKLENNEVNDKKNKRHQYLRDEFTVDREVYNFKCLFKKRKRF